MGHVHYGSATDVLDKWLEARRVTAPCDGCGKMTRGIPTRLVIWYGPEYLWCSTDCFQSLVRRTQAELDAYRAEQGDMVEVCMVYLRLRKPIPDKVRFALTMEEWKAVGKQCHTEYTEARQALAAIFHLRVKQLAVEEVTMLLAPQWEQEQIEQVPLWA